MGKNYRPPTNAKYWCDYCRIYVYNNKICREKHDASPQHKQSVERYIKGVQKEEKLNKNLTSSTTTPSPIIENTSSFYNKSDKRRVEESLVNSLSMKGPIKVTKRPNNSSNNNNIDESILKRDAIIGPWISSNKEPVKPPTDTSTKNNSSIKKEAAPVKVTTGPVKIDLKAKQKQTPQLNNNNLFE